MEEKTTGDPCLAAAVAERRKRFPLKAAPGEGSWQRVLVRGYGFIRLYLPKLGPDNFREALEMGPLVFLGLHEREAARLCDAPGESKA